MGLALTNLQNDHAKNIRELVSRGWFMDCCLKCSKSSSFMSVILH